MFLGKIELNYDIKVIKIWKIMVLHISNSQYVKIPKILKNIMNFKKNPYFVQY